MKEKPRNHDKDKAEDMEGDASLKELAELAMESLDESYRVDWDPFELYAHKLKHHVHADTERFKTHFVQGYERLLSLVQTQVD